MNESCESSELPVLADIARRLATGVGSEEVISGVTRTLSAHLDLETCRVWVRTPEGATYRPADDGPDRPGLADGERVREWLAGPGARPWVDRVAGRGTWPLVTDGPPLGLLEAALPAGRFDTVQATLGIVANMLALWFASSELSQDLATEVAYRTREIDAHRRFNLRIIDSLPVGLYVIDRDYRIRAWNRKREAGTQGITRAQAIGRTVFEVLTRQPADLLKREFDTVFESGQIQQMDVESSTGVEPRFYRISKIPMRLEDDRVSHVITIGEDVTEWKRIQHQLGQTEKLAAVGQLAAGVMHEINNPLATIGACVEALTARTSNLPSTDRLALDEYLRIIDSELERCQAIVDGLLDFSHPRAHAKQPESVNQILDDALFLIKHHDRFRGIRLIRRLDAEVPPIYANAKQLIQVFLALMLNAIDSMDGEGTLTVTSRVNADRPDEVYADISDTGTGINREDFHKIFEPFFTTKVTGRGSGLGLSICYGIVQEHRGRILVNSQVGWGSSFRVFLPVWRETESGGRAP